MSADTVPNELPTASLTVEQLMTELAARPDFVGVVAWHQGPNPTNWIWKSNGCSAGLIFLQLANQILCQSPATPEATADQSG